VAYFLGPPVHRTETLINSRLQFFSYNDSGNNVVNANTHIDTGHRSPRWTEVYSWGAVTSLNCAQNHAAMLEVYLTQTKLKSENSIECQGLFADRLQFYAQQFASACEFTTLHCCNAIYLQHGGGDCCRKNYVTHHVYNDSDNIIDTNTWIHVPNMSPVWIYTTNNSSAITTSEILELTAHYLFSAAYYMCGSVA